jgi:serine/threonine protein phosphatase PrpC
MKRTFAYGVATAQGAWPVQEDGFVADPVRGLFALADGFGGLGAGDISAKLALQEIRKERVAPKEGLFPPEQRKLLAGFSAAHQAILERNRNRPDAGKGGCSLLAAAFTQERSLVLSQCGGCAALLARQGKLLPLLLPQAAPLEAFPLLDQALGLGEIHPESRSLTVEAGDLLVLVSGGVHWAADEFQSALLSGLAVRPGDSLGDLAQQVLEDGALAAAGWNRTLLLVEAH